MTFATRFHRQYEERPHAILVLLAFMVCIWSLTIHAEHVLHHAPAAMTMQADSSSEVESPAIAHPVDAHDVNQTLTPASNMLDCAIPSVLQPVPNQFTLLVDAGIVSDSIGIDPGALHGTSLCLEDVVHRPPGPTRQALLQCFRL